MMMLLLPAATSPERMLQVICSLLQLLQLDMCCCPASKQLHQQLLQLCSHAAIWQLLFLSHCLCVGRAAAVVAAAVNAAAAVVAAAVNAAAAAVLLPI
jgi:hypothetical protein